MTARICLVPRLAGVGGMVSFQHKLARGLAARGIDVCYDLADRPYNAVLVVGGVRYLSELRGVRRRGIPVVQRLDGMNWIHRQERTGLRHFLRAEYGNFILGTIRARLASRIVYQSEFSRRWWERARGPTQAPNSVVYNGVDLEVFTPCGGEGRPTDRYRLLLVEGSLMGGYEQGLRAAVGLASGVRERLAQNAHSRNMKAEVELVIAGRVSEAVRQSWARQVGEVKIHWAGLVEPERVSQLDRSAHLFYASDINPACPNAAIEALACGLPVLAFDTGAMAELVSGDAGRIVPYGGDPWRLEPPDLGALVDGALEILEGGERFRSEARAWAEARFGLGKMVDGYLQALLS